MKWRDELLSNCLYMLLLRSHISSLLICVDSCVKLLSSLVHIPLWVAVWTKLVVRTSLWVSFVSPRLQNNIWPWIASRVSVIGNLEIFVRTGKSDKAICPVIIRLKPSH